VNGCIGDGGVLGEEEKSFLYAEGAEVAEVAKKRGMGDGGLRGKKRRQGALTPALSHQTPQMGEGERED